MPKIDEDAVDGALQSFLTLRRAWSEKPHATGGLAAMAGFDFQLASALEAVVRQEAKGVDGTAFVEVLSDLVERDHGFLVTQAKRTLSSSAFRSALEELWGVHLLALERTPELVPRLRYRVQAARRTLMDWAGSLARWMPEGAEPETLKVFKGLVQVAVTPSPRLDAAKILIEEFKDPDPFGRLDRAMSDLLTSSGGVLDEAVERFRLDLRTLRNANADVERRFGLWSSEDRPPDSVRQERDDRLAVRIGERLAVADLRDGRLGVRSVYERIERACEERLSRDRPLYKLPVFWIAGRSGCGKSAALLHVAARVHAQNPDRLVLWLGSRPALIGAAVRWAGRMALDGRAVVLVLDDPFTAERQSDFIREVIEAQAEWEGLCSSGIDQARSPLLLCCGPTEQRAAAEDACGGQLDFDGYEMPIETDEDLRELADWYAARTGRPVSPMSGNVLLVQQVFEWTKGSISEFAARFKARIRDFDEDAPAGSVFEFVAGVLALNRLYVDYPASELERRKRDDPALESALIRLQELEAHFEFSAREPGGVRLTHPHLADAIYREWFGRTTDRPFRKRHLAAALGAELSRQDRPPEMRYAPLWAISRLARNSDRTGRRTDPALRARIDLIRPELGEVLSDIYGNGLAPDVRPLEDLPVWLALDRLLDLGLAHSPAERLIEAIGAIREPVRGLRLSCHWLLAEEGPFRERAVAAVADCLRRLAGWRDPMPWHDWAPLAMDFVGREGAGPLSGEIAALSRDAPQLRGMSRLMQALAQAPASDGTRAIVVDWLQRTPDDEFGRGFVLAGLIVHGHCAATDALSQRLLAAGRDRRSWPLIWSSLLEGGRVDRSVLRLQGLRWLGLAEDHVLASAFDTPGWDIVWRGLLAGTDDHDPRLQMLLDAASDWLEAADLDDERWTRVWPAASERADARRRSSMLEVAVSRLASAPSELKGWSFVWSPSLQTATSDGDEALVADLLEIGGDWLGAVDPEHLGWAFVFEGMLEADGPNGRERALALGSDWLERSSGTHRSWAHVWLALVRATSNPELEALFRRGVAWLRGAAGDHPGWSRVAGFLLEEDRGSASIEARSLASTWLMGHEAHAGWGPVVGAWVAAGPPSEEIAAFARRCVELMSDAGTEDELWTRIWRAARTAQLAHARLATLAVEFIEAGRGSEGLRASVCSHALGLRLSVESGSWLTAEGERLLASDKLGGSWPLLWDRLTRVEPPRGTLELLDAAAGWLLRVGISTPQWDRVFLRARYVDRLFADRPGIAEAARLWLEEQTESDRWTKVWSAHPDRDAMLHDPKVRAGALCALLCGEQGEAWAHLCASLLRMLDGRALVQTLGVAHGWLGGPADRRGFGRIWRSTLDAEVDPLRRAELVEMGLRSLPLVEASGWYPIYTGLRRDAAARLKGEDAVRSADEWLGSNAGGGDGWLRVLQWRERLKPTPWANHAIVGKADSWLAQNVLRHPRWNEVWRSAMRFRPRAETMPIQALAERWLVDVDPGHRGWPYVWRTLWDVRVDDRRVANDLRTIGVRWLKSGVGHKDRHLVASKTKTPGVTAGGR